MRDIGHVFSVQKTFRKLLIEITCRKWYTKLRYVTLQESYKRGNKPMADRYQRIYTLPDLPLQFFFPPASGF